MNYLDTLKDIAFIKNADLTYHYVNKAFCTFFAISKEEIIGKNDRILFSEEDLISSEETDKQALNKIEATFQHKNLEINKTPVIEEDQVTAICGIGRDITELNCLKNKQIEQKTLIDNLLQGTNAGTWECNVETGKVTINKRTAEIIGYKEEELVDLEPGDWFGLIHPEDQDKGLLHYREIFSKKISNYNINFRQRHKNGTWVWTNSRGVVTEWSDTGMPIKISGTHLDISEQKALELDLIQAKNKAEAANKAKDEFLAVISHELRTPLNPIMGYAGLLQEELKEDFHTESLDIIIKESEHMLELVEDLLHYVSINNDTNKADKYPFNLHLTLLELINSQKAKKSENKLEFYTSKEDRDNGVTEDLTIISNRNIITKILGHLLSNACKYTHKGRVCLSASIIRSDHKQDCIRFEVKDNGIGIDEDKIQTIFDPFVQADSSTTRRYEGVGLGLAICKKLSKQIQGQMGVESKLNEGSTFWLEIPLIRENKLKRSVEIIENKDKVKFKTEWNILIAEDHFNNQKYIKYCLEELNAIAHIVPNGAQVIDALKQKDYDLILMDISMPVMDGIEATKIIRNKLKNTEIPIIALTAHNSGESRSKAQEAGMNSYLAKPVVITELYNIITEQLGQ